MWHSLLWFWVYGPLIFVAFILSIAAMSQRRIFLGLILLLCTIATPIAFLVIFSKRADEHFKKNPSEAYDAGKKIGKSFTENALAQSHPKDEPTPPPIPKIERARVVETAKLVPTPPVYESQPEHVVPEKKAKTDIAITSDTAPLIYELKATSPTPRESIALFVTSGSFGKTDEFSRREFMQKLNRLIDEKKANTKPDDIFSISVTNGLEEYDFERAGFPISSSFSGESNGRRLISISGPEGRWHPDCRYEVSFTNDQHLSFFPLGLEKAKTLSNALQRSRVAAFTYRGTLAACELEEDQSDRRGPHKIVFLKVTEVRIQLRGEPDFVSWVVPDFKDEAPRARILPKNVVAAKPIEKQNLETLAAAKKEASQPAQNDGTKSRPPNDIQSWDLARVQLEINRVYLRYGTEFGNGEVQAWADRQADYRKIPGRTKDAAETFFSEADHDYIKALGARRDALKNVVVTKPDVPSIPDKWGFVIGVPDGDTLTLRSGPAAKSDALHSLKNGDKLRIIGPSSMNGETEWIPVQLGEEKGWIRNKYLRTEAQ